MIKVSDNRRTMGSQHLLKLMNNILLVTQQSPQLISLMEVNQEKLDMNFLVNPQPVSWERQLQNPKQQEGKMLSQRDEILKQKIITHSKVKNFNLSYSRRKVQSIPQVKLTQTQNKQYNQPDKQIKIYQMQWKNFMNKFQYQYFSLRLTATNLEKQKNKYIYFNYDYSKSYLQDQNGYVRPWQVYID
ncbi:unnamed protein product [Paramecium pentaurelia]|uniref:Uncharacterized protein n=1 Tax=Paramecium pentaurelia TaxID=43138 RepID=A0A8S1XF32_9CILI|nr:unnamed protein product [Paramecium pentaurelia]